MSKTIPTRMSPAPTQSMTCPNEDVPIIIIPLVTPKSTDSRPSCINFMDNTTVTSRTRPPISIAIHCQILGTITWKPGNSMGSTIALRNRNWCAIAQGEDSLRVGTSAAMYPNSNPGRNSNSLQGLQYSSISRLPAMMTSNMYQLKYFLSCLLYSQIKANRRPAEPFHPQIKAEISPNRAHTHNLLSFASLGGEGRKGISSFFLMIPVQLIRKATRNVTKPYCTIGMAMACAAWQCAQTSNGHTIRSDSSDNVILGYLPNYLQSQSFQTGSGTGTLLYSSCLYYVFISLISISFCSLMLVCCYHLQIIIKVLSWMAKRQYSRFGLNYSFKFIKMKLTTAVQKNQKPSGCSNAFKLKKMIQKAAENPVQHKSSYRIKDSLKTSEEDATFPKNLHKHPFLISKTLPSLFQQENKENCPIVANLNMQNQQKTWQYTKLTEAHSVKNLHSHSVGNTLFKSHSIKNLQVRKLRCLSKSLLQKTKILKKKQDFKITDFKLGKKLGRGRFGNVFLAEQKITGFLLALKIINKKQLRQAEMEEQLIQEIKLQSFMRHPNILAMYGFFHDQTNVYMMLQLANQCLFRVLRKNGNFPENEAAYYIRQVNQGLKYMHSQNILHRDLKPQNIMLVNNVVKLADFGWSVYSPIYKRQTFCGTLDYVSPEIVKGDFYDETIDIWSLGILLYQLTVGSAPFEGNNSEEEETLQKIVNGSYVIPQFLSEPLKRLITQFLNNDPQKRCTLDELEETGWIKLYSQQGRSISPKIWHFWEYLR